MKKICLPAHFCLIILLLLPRLGTAQQNTIDSLHHLLDKAKHDTTRVDLLRVMGFAYSYRDFPKAEESFELALAVSHQLHDTLRLAQTEAQYALYYFLCRSINHQAMEHFQEASQLLQKRTDTVSQALKSYIHWYRLLLNYNTTSTSYNTTFEKDLFDKSMLEMNPVASILEAHEYWLEATAVYFFLSTVETYKQSPEEAKASIRFRLKCLHRMEEVFRNANYYEGTGIANAYLARNIHYMGIGGMPGLWLTNPVDKTTISSESATSKEPSKQPGYYPIDWKTCLKLDEVYYRKALMILIQAGNIRQQGVVYNALAYKCLERNQYDSAMLFYNKARSLAFQMNDTRELLHFAQTPQDIYVAKGDYKTATHFYNLYMFFLDSINKINTEQTMAALTKSYSIKLKESEIEKLQTDAAYLAARQRQQTILFVTGLSFLLIVCGLVIYAYYQRRKSNAQLEKNIELQSLLQANLETALQGAQLTAARAQMNPHFVYNSINAIQNLILKENKNEAISYLNDFSKLTRETLENSNKETITLKEEISFLEHYLQLESLRSANQFDYRISCAEDIDTGYERIPPMMLQPFIENAIKHGFPSNPRRNKIIIKFETLEGSLLCTIEDNGIGRTASAKVKERNHHSMATEITNTRMELLQEKASLKQKYQVHIEDLYDEKGVASGTKVILAIPIESISTA